MLSWLRKILPKSLILFYHRLLAQTAAFFYGYPSEKMTVIGVTGTEGKTTTVNLIAAILEEAGKKTAAASTANFKIGEKFWVNETKQTMLGRFKLQKFLAQALTEKCVYAVIETSSQGIEQSRHLGVNYDVAVLTNLSGDHLEAHGSFADYQKEKEKLFAKLAADSKKNGQPKIIAANLAEKQAPAFLKYPADLKLGFYLNDETNLSKADLTQVKIIKGVNSRFTPEGTIFEVRHGHNSFQIETPLLGGFNLQNSLAAITVALALKVEPEKIQAALKKFKGVPGRLELVNLGQDYTVVIDYAHTENSLREVFAAIKPLVSGRVLSVLGSCGGGRDKKKRPVLGEIAGHNADLVIVTNEDPYDEDPMTIINEVAAGALSAGKKLNENCFKISDRGEAIRLAIKSARAGDLVLITGKGSETCLAVANDKKIPWSDREEAKKAIVGAPTREI